VPVLLEPVIAKLHPRLGETAVDCTVGFGGHAKALLERIGPAGRLIAIDRDRPQLEATRDRLATREGNPLFVHDDYANLPDILQSAGVDKADVILADLGTSAMQVDDPGRGFNYAHEGPLDMRMDVTTGPTAAELLGTLSAEELTRALRELSDEPDAERIAAWIAAQQAVDPIADTQRLVRLILDAKGVSAADRKAKPWKRLGGGHPAARTFQALRILVNDELASLEALLAALPGCLAPGGRVGIISFQPGEDRWVKQAFRRGRQTGLYEAASDKPLQPSRQEIRRNPRSASARFRWARRNTA
jgi:16S rRNA (cytosine1402-N4)-methyltransferase